MCDSTLLSEYSLNKNGFFRVVLGGCECNSEEGMKVFFVHCGWTPVMSQGHGMGDTCLDLVYESVGPVDQLVRPGVERRRMIEDRIFHVVMVHDLGEILRQRILKRRHGRESEGEGVGQMVWGWSGSKVKVCSCSPLKRMTEVRQSQTQTPPYGSGDASGLRSEQSEWGNSEAPFKSVWAIRETAACSVCKRAQEQQLFGPLPQDTLDDILGAPWARPFPASGLCGVSTGGILHIRTIV